MEQLIGKTINKIFLDEDYLTFEVDNGEIITFVAIGDCCSISVWYDFYGVEEILGKKVIDVKDIQLTNDDFLQKRLISKDNKNYDSSIEIYGVSLTFVSAFGERTATVSFRNYSNGYYGGYYRLAKERRSNNQIFTDVFETSKV